MKQLQRFWTQKIHHQNNCYIRHQKAWLHVSPAAGTWLPQSPFPGTQNGLKHIPSESQVNTSPVQLTSSTPEELTGLSQHAVSTTGCWPHLQASTWQGRLALCPNSYKRGGFQNPTDHGRSFHMPCHLPARTNRCSRGAHRAKGDKQLFREVTNLVHGPLLH